MMKMSNRLNKFFLAIICSTCATSLAVSAECVIPVGLGTSCPEGECVDPADFDNIPHNNTFGAAIGTILAQRPGLVGAESPIQSHWTSTAVQAIYGAAAAFHPTALDMFARQAESDSRRRCDADASGMSEQEWHRYRQVTILYSVLWGMAGGVTYKMPAGGGETAMRDLADSFGIDYDICDVVTNCDDINTPWGLAKVLVQEATDFTTRDGWNKDGSLSSTFNKVPYEDWRDRPYTPKNSPWKLSRPTRWQPIIENDGNGYISNQEHVTPHIGQTAKSIYLGDDDICARTEAVADPNYDLHAEALLTLNRTRHLTEEQKAEIEFFDNKFLSLLPLQVQQFQRMGYNTDDWEFIKSDAALIESIREATIVVWRSKVMFDMVRPPSWIRAILKNNYFDSYGGAEVQGEAYIQAKEWHPYNKVMPHSEFPSGSACICKSFAETMIALTGVDDFTADIGGPLVFPVTAGSSKREKGRPLQDLEFSYSSWGQIAERCRQSRIEGGMHFTASIYAGQDLCTGVGTKVGEAFNKLENGEKPAYIADFYDTRVTKRRLCKMVLSKLNL